MYLPHLTQTKPRTRETLWTPRPSQTCSHTLGPWRCTVVHSSHLQSYPCRLQQAVQLHRPQRVAAGLSKHESQHAQHQERSHKALSSTLTCPRLQRFEWKQMGPNENRPACSCDEATSCADHHGWQTSDPSEKESDQSMPAQLWKGGCQRPSMTRIWGQNAKTSQ